MKNKNNLPELSEEEKKERTKQMLKIVGLMAGIFSKSILESQGVVVDYKLNGENISDIEKLHELDISDRIKLAVEQERYEDAANLKKILEQKKKIN